MSHAHANLIVHRDLKPSNIMVTPLDEVRLLDFGIAKLLDGSEPGRDNTRTEVRAFTLHYAAPEQIRGEPVTTMTDVYSLGVVLYELMAETKPYKLKRQTDAEWEEAILISDPQKPSATLLREADSDPIAHAGAAPTREGNCRGPGQYRAEGACRSGPNTAIRRWRRWRWICTVTWKANRCWPGRRAWPTAATSSCSATAGRWPPPR